MFSKFKHRKSVAVLAFLLQVSCFAPTAMVAADATKPVWQETNSTAANYLSNRRALVGSGCMVNRLGSDGVNVVPVITNLENLCDEDLTNVMTVAAGVDATVAANPLVSVRDVKNYYAAGTQAGFVVTGEASGLLSLSAANFFCIMFYCDGELVGTKTVEEGQSVNGVGLSLIQISDSEASKEYVATAPAKFDEIRLAQTGALDATVVKVIGIKYAFVGKAKEYTITQKSMAEYNSDLEVQSKSYSTTLIENASVSTYWRTAGNLDDDILTNKTAIEGFLSLGTSPHAEVRAIPKSSTTAEAFAAGTTVGFKFHQASALSLGLGTGYVIALYDRNDKQVYHKLLSLDVLGLNIAAGTDASLAVTSDVAFSRADFYIDGVKVDLGGVSVYYAYISLPLEVEKHHCDINASASLNVCDCDNQYQLSSGMDVTWSVKSQPEGGEATVSNESGTKGLVTGLVEHGTYVFTATAADGCTEDVTIKYGASADIKNTTETVERLVNKTGETALYEATSGSSIDISIFGSLKNSDALVSPTLRDYAYTTAGADLLGKSHIISLHKKSGTFNYSTKKYVGFVVKAKTTALNASLLDFLTVDLYKGGTKVSGSLVKNNAVLSADLINTAGNAEQRTSYMVEVPAGTEFDEIALNKIGTLTADLSQLNIYYAFVSDNDGNPETSGMVVSYNNTGASIDAANTEFVAVANVANTAFGLTDLVDDDLTTAVTLPAVSVANGTKIGVKIGKTINPAKQSLLIVTSNTSAVLEAELVKVLKVELYKGGEKVANSTSGSGVDVLNANVLGYTNTHNYIEVTGDKEYDEVVLTYGNGATVADAFKIYGLLLRNDYNQDGIVDEIDPEPCAQELVLDEGKNLQKSHDYNNTRMIFHRNFNGDKWNSVILPVDLTKAQFTEAFGSDAKLSEVKEVVVDESTTDGVTTTTTTLVFTLVNSETDGVFMAKNTPYIIYTTATELANHSVDARYESIEDGEVVGPMFFVETGISYDKGDDYKTTHSASSSSSAASGQVYSFTGSYNCAQELAIGSYVFNKGDLYRTTKTHKQKAYRCWVEYSKAGDSSSKESLLNGFGIDSGGTTEIHSVVDGSAKADGAVYNLSGQRMNPAQNLSRGVYIMNGKKFIVK